MNLHNTIVEAFLNFNPVISVVNKDMFFEYPDTDFVNYASNEIKIEMCKDGIEYCDGTISYFESRCIVDLERILNGLKIQHENIDGYGSAIAGNELLLNNYDAIFEEDANNSAGFCNVLGFATVDNLGNVKFSQVVYSFKFNKCIVRDQFNIKLPFVPDLKSDFGGKRATYRYGNILSLRTTLSVYDKVDNKYKQHKRKENTLSYPRLILRDNDM
jgi:hypothetical protein